MKYKILFTLFMLSSLALRAQDHKFQSLFVYNFAKYIEWPTAKQQGDFIIGVIGGQAAVAQFKNTLEGKTKGTQKIVVQALTTASSYTNCHMIFVTADQHNAIGKITEAVGQQAILIVTEKEGALKEGSSINMFIKNGKMAFEINEQIKKSNLKVSSEVMRLAQS
jgi:YfiR/HmsC-like